MTLAFRGKEELEKRMKIDENLIKEIYNSLTNEELTDLKNKYFKLKKELKNGSIQEIIEKLPELKSINRKINLENYPSTTLLSLIDTAHKIQLRKVETYQEYLIYLIQKKLGLISKEIEGVDVIERKLKLKKKSWFNFLKKRH